MGDASAADDLAAVKAKAAPDPRPPTEQFDLWGALADFGEATEAAVPRPAKVSRRRSRTA